MRSMQETPIPIIKLTVPPLHPNHLERPRLEGLIDQAGMVPRSILLVSAPPGYGKSTLVAGWLAKQEMDHAWITLDGEDDDPGRFVTLLSRALLPHLAGDEGTAKTSVGESPHAEVDETVAVALSNQLARRAQPLLLILDDLHNIESQEIYGFLDSLLRLQPPNLHLMLITREDPPLSLSRLRAQGRLIDIRMEELGFTREETEELFSTYTAVSIDPDHLGMLQEKTEGWAAALQLAMFSISRQSDVESFIEQFSGNDRHIIDYLMDEVLRSQPPEIIEFLNRTSQLDRFNPEICDHITGRRDSSDILRRLERENLLIRTVDSTHHWFRYHTLFADFLSTRLSRQEREEINREAATWFDGAAMRTEAIRHAVKSAQPDRFLPLICGEVERLIEAGRPGEVFQILAGMEQDVLRRSDRLAELYGWALYLYNRQEELLRLIAEFKGKHPPLPRGLAILDELLHPGSAQPVRGEPEKKSPGAGAGAGQRPTALQEVLYAIGASLLAVIAGDLDGALLEAQRARNLYVEDSSRFIATCLSYNYASALLLNGDAGGALAFLTRELDSPRLADGGDGEALTPLLRVPLAASGLLLKRSVGVTPKSVEEALALYENIDASHLLLEHAAVLAAPYFEFHGLRQQSQDLLVRSLRTETGNPVVRHHHSRIRNLLEAPEQVSELAEPLSGREREVLRELARGLSNAEIGEVLYISTGTVKWHVNRLLTKLEAQSRTQAVAKARELGLI